MPKSTVELRQKRHKLLEDAKVILDKADEEKRDLSAEEDGQYRKMREDANSLKSEIEKTEDRNRLEQEIADNAKPVGEQARTNEPGDESGDGEVTYRQAFQAWLLRGPQSLTVDEQRALSAGTATEGGYLYPDEQFVDTLIQAVTDATIIRSLANVMSITGTDSLGAPTLSNRMGAAQWGSELGVPSTDSTLSFGKRELAPHPMAREIRVSKTLLRKAPNAEGIVTSELARVGGELEENAFMTGSGAQQPLGLFTASGDGISTSRDVSTGNTNTAPTFDGLKAARYELKDQHWALASWIFHRDGMEIIAKLKDGNGRYLLQDSVTQDEPDVLLGAPVRLSEFAPNTFTSGNYFGILGNYQHYWIVDSQDIEIARAQELLIRSNQDLFVMRSAVDAAPVLEEAFVRVTLT